MVYGEIMKKIKLRLILLLLLNFQVAVAVNLDFEYENNLIGDELKTALSNEIKNTSGNQYYLEWAKFSDPSCPDDIRVRTVKTDSYTGLSSLEVLYPQGKILTESCGGSGTQFQIKTVSTNQENYLVASYAFRLKEGFSYGSSPSHEVIKLPGLAAENDNKKICSGSQKCTNNSFSLRLSLRNGDKEATLSDDDYAGGEVYLYSYEPLKKCSNGEYYNLTKPDGQNTFIKPEDGWNVIVSRVQVNTFDDMSKPVSDGVVEIFLNGQQIFFNKIMVLVSDKYKNNSEELQSVLVDVFVFSTFFGGSDDESTSKVEYAPLNDSYILFDSLKIGSDFNTVAGNSVVIYYHDNDTLHIPSIRDSSGTNYSVELVKEEGTNNTFRLTNVQLSTEKTAFLSYDPNAPVILSVAHIKNNQWIGTFQHKISFDSGDKFTVDKILDLTYRQTLPNRILCFRD